MEIVSTRLEYPYTALPTRKRVHGDLDCWYKSFAGIGLSSDQTVLRSIHFEESYFNVRGIAKSLGIQAMLNENAVLTADAEDRAPHDNKDQGLLERRKVNRHKQPILLLNKICLCKSHQTSTLKFIFSHNLSGLDL